MPIDSTSISNQAAAMQAQVDTLSVDSLSHVYGAEQYSYLSADSVGFDLLQPVAAPHLEVQEIVPAEEPLPWEKGLEGDVRYIGVGNNSGVLAIVACVFTLIMLSYRNCKRLFVSLYKSLSSMRERENAFNEHTSNETRVLGLMAVQWSVCTGLLLYSIFSRVVDVPPGNAFNDTGLLILLMGGYYVFQYCAYSLVGFTFADTIGRKLYVQGFIASQSLLGFALIIPSLVSIFYATASIVGIVAGVLLYFIARMVFIVKGFRIFYTDFYSLFYFILYLCTLEIIPLVLVCNTALIILKK